MEEPTEWFEIWFNSPYYHIFYDHRNEEEANLFITKLKDHLGLNETETIMDLACGAGRHAAFLSEYVKEAIGVDLSHNSIRSAKQNYEKKNLEFYTHDMRLPFRINYFDYIFNFFTSFGYFKKSSDNLKVLQSIRKGLRKDGKVVIDFMNAKKAVDNLVEREEIEKQGINFYVRREVVNGIIKKHIKFDDKDRVYSFTESVQALMQEDFHKLLKIAGFEIEDEFGNYNLEAFNQNHSDRYIVIAKKN